MAKANHGEQLANFVSPREFWGIRHDPLGNELINMYAENLAKRVGTATSIRNFMEQIFGERWYDEPYQKLYKIAKLTVPKGSAGKFFIPKRVWSPTVTERVHKIRAHKERVYNSYTYRFCKRYYKSALVDEFIERRASWTATAGGYNTIENALESLAYVIAYARKYDKQCLKMLKKASTVEQLTGLEKSASDVGKYVSGCYTRDISVLSASQRDDFIKTVLKAVITEHTSNDVDEITWAQLTHLLYDRLGWQVSKLSYYSVGKNQYKTVAKAMKECEKIKDLKRMFDKLGLSLTNGKRCNAPYTTWHTNRISNKSYRLVKQLEKAYDSGTDKGVIQNMAKRRLSDIHSQNYSHAVYTPLVYGVKE